MVVTLGMLIRNGGGGEGACVFDVRDGRLTWWTDKLDGEASFLLIRPECNYARDV